MIRWLRRSGTLLYAVLALATLSLSAGAEELLPGGSEADHQELREALAKVTDAINESRFEEMKPLLYKKFSMTLINQEQITSEADLDDFLKRWFTGPDRLIKSHKMEPEANELTQIIDGRFAIARGTNRETYEMMRGVNFTFNSRWTASLVKDEGKWKLAAIHNGIDFTDNPVLRAAAASAPYFGAGGFALGVLGTMLVGRLRRRGR